jgi:hypothetical protein
MHAPPHSDKRRTFVIRLSRVLAGPAAAVGTICLAFPGASAAHAVGARTASAGLPSTFTASDLLILAVGGAAALVFSAFVSRLGALIGARHVPVAAHRVASVSVEPEPITTERLADAPADAPAESAAAA